MPSLRFFVTCVLAATAAELTKLQTISRGLLVLCRNVVAALAFAALQHNVISRHKLFPISDCQFPISNFYVRPVTFVFPIGNRQLEIGNDAIRPPLKPCPHPPLAHLRSWRTATLSP